MPPDMQTISGAIREFLQQVHEYLSAAGFPGDPFEIRPEAPIVSGPVDTWIAQRLRRPNLHGFVKPQDAILYLFPVVRMRIESAIGLPADKATAWSELRAFVDLLGFNGTIEPAVAQRVHARLDLLKP